MKLCISVFLSDQIIVDESGRKIVHPPEVIFEAISNSYKSGFPVNFGHDSRKLIGWCIPDSIYIEPGITRAVSRTNIAESEEEFLIFKEKLEKRDLELVARQGKEFDQLRDLISDSLVGDEIPLIRECICFYKKGVLKRVLPELYELIDQDGLLPLKDLEILGGVFRRGELAFFVHRYFRRFFYLSNNVNTPFLTHLFKLDPEYDVRIKIDPDLIGLASTYTDYEELEYWWGPNFDDDLNSIPQGVTKYGADEYNKSFDSLSHTEFGWFINHGQRIFEVEEIYEKAPIVDFLENEEQKYGTRYAHSIVYEDTNQIHFDGAIRIYTPNLYELRRQYDIAHFNRSSGYMKLWRIDGRIPVNKWKILLTHYFRGNYMIGEYLGGKDEEYSKRFQESTTKKEIDTRLKGIQFSISFHSRKNQANDFLSIKPPDSLIDTIPKDFIDIVKEGNTEIRIFGNWNFLQEYQAFVYLPIISFGTSDFEKNMKLIMSFIKQLVKKLRNNPNIRYFGYSLEIPIKEDTMIFSILGSIKNIDRWLNNAISVIKYEEGNIKSWVKSAVNFIYSNYKSENGISPISKILKRSGVLYYNNSNMKEY